MEHLIETAPLFAVGLALVLAFLAAAELGYALRRRMVRQRRSADDDSHVGYVISAALGLLALLLGFTFSVALGRYETRRDLVVAEANAIGTAALQAELLPAAEAARFAAGLRRYVALRQAYQRADDDPAAAEPIARAARATGRALWRAAGARLIDGGAPPLLARALLDSLSEAFHRAEDRDAAHVEHVPARVITMLLLYAVVTAAMLGFALGGTASRHRGIAAAFFVLLAIAITLILDLDRAQRGAILISQRPMDELAADLALAAPPRPTDASIAAP